MAICRQKQGNKVYLKEYKSIRVDGKVKHVFVKYLGVEGKDGKPERRPEHVLDKVKIGSGKSYGAVAVLWKLAQQLKIEETIDKIVGRTQGFSVGKLLTICSINKCLDPQSLSTLQRWYRRTDLPSLTGYTPEIISKNNFLSAMDTVCGLKDGEEYDLTLNIEKELLTTLKEVLPTGLIEGMFYDITASIYHGSNCMLAEVGHITKDTSKSQINVALVTSKKFGIPLFHNVFRGDVRDVKTIGNLLHIMKQFGIEETTLVWDRGNASHDTTLWSEFQGLQLITGLRKDLLEVQRLFKVKRIEERYDTLIRKYGSGAIYAQVCVTPVFGKKRKVVIYVNTFTRDKSRSRRNDRIKQALDKLAVLSTKNLTRDEFERRVKRVVSGIQSYIWTHYENKGDGHAKLQYGVQEHTLEKDSYNDGKFALMSTNLNLSTEEIVNTYFAKNDIESAFKILKHVMDMTPINHRLTHRVRSYMFICFLSYLLHSYFLYLLRQANIIESAQKILESLDEVEKIDISYGGQDQIRYLNLGTFQKDVLRKLEMESICPHEKIDRTNL